LGENNQRGVLYVNPTSIVPAPTTGQVIAVDGRICYRYTGNRSGSGSYTHTGNVDYSDCARCEGTLTSMCPVLAECCSDSNITAVVAIDNTVTLNSAFLHNGTCYTIKSFNAANGQPENYITFQYATCPDCENVNGSGCA
jgi:hypothetical protein